MKFWFQIVVTIGIIFVSVASVLYTWHTWRAYRLEMRAEEVCTYYLDSKRREFDSVEIWFTQRQCVNRVMGKGEAKGLSPTP